jgi:hypothetical protein
MNDERKRILQMLSEGKITVDEAERLLEAIPRAMGSQGEGGGLPMQRAARKPKYLRIEVNSGKPGKADRVNIRVPLGLLKAGVRLKGLIPGDAAARVNSALKDKGIDLDSLKGNALEELLENLADLEVNVNEGSDGDTVRIFCE